MLRTSASLFRRPIISLRSGAQIAMALEPVIDPHNLKILGWWCQATSIAGPAILLSEDVREAMPQGLAVNDEAALSSTNDLVRHREILKIRFKLIGKVVKTKKRKLGRVSDFSYDDGGLFVQKLYVNRSIVKVFVKEDTLIIDRQQIVEITDRHIVVEEADIKDSEVEEAVAPAAIAS